MPEAQPATAVEGDRGSLARTIFSVLFIVGLAVASFWVLKPFFAAFIWAATIVVATWPLLLRTEGLFGGRRVPAVILMTLAMLLIVIVPLLAAVVSLADHAPAMAAWLIGLPARELPAAPAWLDGLPLLGGWAAATWNDFAGTGFGELTAHLQPYMSDIGRWLVAEAGALGLLLVQGALIVAICALLYANGEAWAAWLLRLGRRLDGDRGGAAIVLAGQAIRGVALGVVVTAFLQAVLGGLGLLLAGVPFAGALTVLMFVLCIAQLGPSLVLGGALLWLYLAGSSGWAIALLLWSVVVVLMDNFVRPLLIRRSASLPLLLIFAGVVGGMLGFGLVGIFVGPVVLAVAYTLINAWMAEPLPAVAGDDPG